MQKFSGSRENELKTFLGTRGFINEEQGIKSKEIKGSREHVPLPPPLGRGSLKISTPVCLIIILTD